MKCPTCVAEGKRSTVTQGTSTTLALYVPIQWDENGDLIERPGLTSTNYSCSNGHEWTVES